MHLSNLELLSKWLTEENHAELLEAASGKSKREVEALLAARFPMSHANPTRDLAVVVERAVDALLVQLEKKRLARAKRPRPEQTARKAKSRRITNATRRRVFERDGLGCTYVSPDGRRCEARAFLELDHAEPAAIGGGDEAHNLRVRCRAHNQLWAEQAYGREHVERARNFRRKKCGRPRSDERPVGGGRPRKAEEPAMTGASLGVLEKVHVALRGMGFGDAQARRAVAEVRRAHDEPPPIEQALREALFLATAR